MSTVLEPLKEVTGEPVSRSETRWKVKFTREHLALSAILLLSAFLGLWNLSINNYSNEFYASAVRSMTQSWHNFFYLAFDPGAFVTVDKPPLAFMIQAAFAKVLGFNGVSLLLPEALAGVGGVFLLYLMIKRAFGTAAGLLSALMLAITPIFVAMNRDNNPDSLLVFTLIVAAWAILRAAELGKLRWLLLSGVLVGLAFNIKMLEAWIVLPAFYLMYFLFARTTWLKKVLHLAAATLVILIVSFSWAVAVDLTPASDRPYIDGSTNNTVVDLIFGYNGLGRVDGNENGSGGMGRNNGNASQGQLALQGGDGSQATNSAQRGFPGGQNFQAPPNSGQPGNFGGPGGPGGGAGFGGQPGITRLIVPQMAGEFNWFFPLALLGLVFLSANAWFGMKKGLERSRRLQMVALWGGWFLLYGIVLSFSKGIIHNYYMTIIAPAEAALAGTALVMLWKSYKQGGWLAWLLPVGVAATAFYQAYILTGFTSWNWWLSPVLLVAGLGTLVGLSAGIFLRNQPLGQKINLGMVGAITALLLVTPALWSIRLLSTSLTGSIPSGTPTGAEMGGFGRNSASASSTLVPQAWLDFIKSNLSGQLTLLLSVVVLAGVVIGLKFLFRKGAGKFFSLPVVSAVLLAFFLIGSTSFWINVAQAKSTTSSSFSFDRMGNFGGPEGGQTSQQLIQYLEQNQDGYKYLVAVSDSNSASSMIIETGLPVMSMGGFSGSDKIITTTAQVEQLIRSHTVRYFMLGGRGGSNNAVSQYVQQSCKVVDSSLYSASNTSSGTGSTQSGTTNTFRDGRNGMGGFGGQQALYVCGS
ncbi:MAG TPA: glycosyltransferase family 39 protein [Chloroflexia bacterium]|nr:glycosyltransferase family 39 protein [Chloroflexia bacterium]